MKKIGIYTLLALVFLTSCQDWLTVQPDTQSEEDDLYSTPRGFKDALAGVYILFFNTYRVNGFMMGRDIEHLACQWETEPQSVERSLNDHEYIRADVDDKFQTVFSEMYKTLANVNVLIKHLRKEDCILVEKDQNYYLGQALAIRAFVCFDLIRLWGPVPGHVADGHEYLPYPEELHVAPHPYLTYEKYMEKLMRDLDESESLLRTHHGYNFESNTSRFNIFTVQALKARIALWLGDTEKAAQYARKLIFPELGGVKYYLGTRRYFQESPQPHFTCENFIQLAYNPDAILLLNEYIRYNDLLYGVFEGQSTDVRFQQWKAKTSNNPDGDFMNLTKFVIPYDPSSEESVKNQNITISLLRLSEMYFILMESTEDLEEANSLYEEFCNARGCKFKKFADKQSIKNQMLLEYKREFYGEGQLFYLYKRYYVRIMPGSAKSCDISSYVLPLPQRETNI